MTGHSRRAAAVVQLGPARWSPTDRRAGSVSPRKRPAHRPVRRAVRLSRAPRAGIREPGKRLRPPPSRQGTMPRVKAGTATPMSSSTKKTLLAGVPSFHPRLASVSGKSWESQVGAVVGRSGAEPLPKGTADCVVAFLTSDFREDLRRPTSRTGAAWLRRRHRAIRCERQAPA